ncbi:MAG: META domain-containing protein [Pseudomonadota bacterium]
MIRPAILVLILASGCGGDETISGYADRDTTWRLTELDGAAFPARATLRFPEEGQMSGSGPCNSFSAAQTAPYPWFESGPIAATRRACPELQEEGAFFTALGEMQIAEVSGSVLILSNEAGRSMVFEVDSAI